VTGMGELPGAFGYADEYTAAVLPESNEAEMIYLDPDAWRIGEEQYLGALTHEFQHMIQWNNEGNEAHWLDEGMSQLAERVAGFRSVSSHFFFLRQSRTQLNAWVESRPDQARHYGAAYLYALYLQERLGDDFVRSLARHPSESLASVNATLAEQGLDLTADDLFADWIVANYLDDPSLADGRYGYQSETLGPICPRQRYTALPAKKTNTLPQYSADYIEIDRQGQFTIDFQGAVTAPLIPTEAHSGQSFWWSNRGDNAETYVVRGFDLSGLDEATLQFWTWFDIQESADWACVSVSTDGGQTWEFPEGQQAKPGQYYPCYVGRSGMGDQPRWVMEEMDLSVSST
jgi:immune inhibitor A